MSKRVVVGRLQDPRQRSRLRTSPRSDSGCCPGWQAGPLTSCRPVRHRGHVLRTLLSSVRCAPQQRVPRRCCTGVRRVHGYLPRWHCGAAVRGPPCPAHTVPQARQGTAGLPPPRLSAGLHPHASPSAPGAVHRGCSAVGNYVPAQVQLGSRPYSDDGITQQPGDEVADRIVRQFYTPAAVSPQAREAEGQA
jgi:hypothetical protein